MEDRKGYISEEDNVSLSYGPAEGIAPQGKYLTNDEQMSKVKKLLKPKTTLSATPKIEGLLPICATIWENGVKSYFSVYPGDIISDVTDEKATFWYSGQSGTYQALYQYLAT